MKSGFSALTGLAFLVGGVRAVESGTALPVTILKVEFKAVPGLIYNRLGDSVLNVSSPAGTQSVKLSGTPYPADRQYWAQLVPVRLKLSLPTGSYSVMLRAKLFVCDKRRGLCSVQTREQRFQVSAGRVNRVTLTAPTLPLNP
ncbi:hypothetical protein [Deinococcus alpinitundrae]|uniref:hypothetical protein n=1 Tax=Deinococcus alpinitundrae TaxID=468913 RepID=UPI00137AC363|nr:hypothetical protein [Deinococcus alpinitundrae]